ncbi:MAG TPA: cupin domain-containing protein [Blastocatellia bacterium]|nr:cupin domain-containing protein [Blastocatellia bacterium]
MKKQMLLLTLAVLALTALCFAQSATEHKMVAPEAIKWGPLWPGSEIAVLSGNPLKDGDPFVLRLKFVAGAKVPPHWHPSDEHLTVIKGAFYMGKGEKFDESAGHALTVGSYMMMPKQTPHFAWTKEETIVQVHGIGPFKTTWVNPADDPAKRASSN